MKFRDLEIGQMFTRVADGALCTKISPGGYTYTQDGRTIPVYLSKRERDFNVTPEGEPPSSIAAAKRDARWYLLSNMEVTTDEVKELRDRGQISIFEAQRRLKQATLQSGLEVLKLVITNEPERTAEVLHDLIEIVKELT